MDCGVLRTPQTTCLRNNCFAPVVEAGSQVDASSSQNQFEISPTPIARGKHSSDLLHCIMGSNGAVANGAHEESQRFLDLLRAAGDPTTSTLPSDSLAASLGIDGLPTAEGAVAQVEETILSPPKDLSGPNLWRWQAPLPTVVPLPSLRLDALPQTHTVTPTFRGIDGEFTHWREALAPKPPAHPNLSSSMNREPAPLQNFVRGKSTNAPFLPGGLDLVPVEDTETEEPELEEEEGWKTRAPGFRRGAELEGGELTSAANADERSRRLPCRNARRAVHDNKSEAQETQWGRVAAASGMYQVCCLCSLRRSHGLAMTISSRQATNMESDHHLGRMWTTCYLSAYV